MKFLLKFIMTETRYVYGVCYDGEIVYTGSTKNMTKRWEAYKNDHLNPNAPCYRMNISKFMREKGFDNFSHVIIEKFDEITKKDILQYEGMWQDTLIDLGFNLLNKLGAGNGANGEWGTIGYHNHLARNSEKIPCELCGKFVRRGGIRDHQRTDKCKAIALRS